MDCVCDVFNQHKVIWMLGVKCFPRTHALKPSPPTTYRRGCEREQSTKSAYEASTVNIVKPFRFGSAQPEQTLLGF